MAPAFLYEKLDNIQDCPACERQVQPSPHRRTKYWVISFFIHAAFLFLSFWAMMAYLHPHIFWKTVTGNTEASSEIVGTISAPLGSNVHYRIQSESASDWYNELYFGEPSYESEYAWNDLLRPHNVRLSRDEAARLNISDSIRARGGEDYVTILGVIHNLHCLRRIRQTLHSEYYYPDRTEHFIEHDRAHAAHCLEALRTSLMCNPDLNLHPYFYSNLENHNLSASAKVTRKCANFDALQEMLLPRSVDHWDLMPGTGPSS